MWFFTNLAVVNSYIVFKKSQQDPTVPNGYDHLTFRADVAKGLPNGFTSRKQCHGRKGRSINTLDVSVHSMGHHKLVRKIRKIRLLYHIFRLDRYWTR